MRILILILLGSTSVYGAEKPVCDANAVTRNCKFFEERKDQPKIKLADGSSFSNPMYVTPLAGQEGANLSGSGPIQGGYGGAAALTTEEIEALQTNQAELMDQMPGKAFSTRFKMAFANSAGYLAANPEVKVSMPWPPDAKSPKLTPVTGQEVLAYAKANMKGADYAKLMKLVDVQKAPQVKAALAMQKAQQAQLELQKKAQEEALVESQRLNNKKARIRELFKYSQEQIIALISQGRKESDLGPEQKRQIAKVRSVELHSLDDEAIANSSSCMGGSRNAYYISLNHQTHMCPGLFNSNDATIVSVLGHEIAHSIDACASQMPLMNVHREMKDSFMNRKDLTEDERQDVESLLDSSDKYFNYDMKIYLTHPEVLDKMTQAGLVKVEISETPYKNYPQRKELECLAKSANFYLNESGDSVATKRALNRGIARLPADARPPAEKMVRRYGEALDTYPQCFNTLTGTSNSREVTADLFGALVLEKFIMDFPPKTEEEKVASVEFWLDNSCSASGPAKVKNIDADSVTPMMLSKYFSNSSRFEPHPETSTRLKYLYLNLPGMANLFDCKREGNACFDHMSFYNRSGSGQKSSNESQLQKGTR